MLVPFYNKDGITIYCGDCLSILPLVNENIDLTLTDPPYNVGMNYPAGDNRVDYKEWCFKWFSMLPRPIYFTPGAYNMALWYSIENPKWVMAWFKDNQLSRTRLRAGFMCWEPILVYGDGQKVNHDAFYEPMEGNQKDTGNHPCPKAPKAWGKLMTLVSKKGDLILDPFLGSGTTAVCAKRLQRRCIGIEINEGYCKIAVARLAQEVMKF